MEKAIPDSPSENAAGRVVPPAALDDLNVEVKLDLTQAQMSATELQALIDSSEIKSPSAQQLMEHLGHYANEHS